MRNVWNKSLDSTVIFSFDKTGFLRREKEFKENLLQKNAEDKVSLVTGGLLGLVKRLLKNSLN